MKLPFGKIYSKIPAGIICLVVVFVLFFYLGHKMGTPNMLNTIMNTAHDLLLNTVFYLMAICAGVAIIAHTIGGLVAAFIAHWVYVLYALI
jgi:hypothetical protein